MSEDYGESHNPYQTPREPSDPSGLPGGKGRPPNGLKAIAIIAIILGSLGLVANAFSVLQLVLADQMAAMQPQQPGQEELNKINEEVTEATKKYTVFGWLTILLHIPLSIALLVGGVKSLKGQSSGRSMLAMAVGFTLLFELARNVLAIVIQWEMFQIVGEGAKRLPAGDQSVAMLQMILLVSAVCGVVWLLAKLVYYVTALIFLRKPHVKEYFEAGDSGFGKPFDPGFSQ